MFGRIHHWSHQDLGLSLEGCKNKSQSMNLKMKAMYACCITSTRNCIICPNGGTSLGQITESYKSSRMSYTGALRTSQTHSSTECMIPGVHQGTLT